MKRRNFFRNALALPAVPALLSGTSADAAAIKNSAAAVNDADAGPEHITRAGHIEVGNGYPERRPALVIARCEGDIPYVRRGCAAIAARSEIGRGAETESVRGYGLASASQQQERD